MSCPPSSYLSPACTALHSGSSFRRTVFSQENNLIPIDSRNCIFPLKVFKEKYYFSSETGTGKGIRNTVSFFPKIHPTLEIPKISRNRKTRFLLYNINHWSSWALFEVLCLWRMLSFRFLHLSNLTESIHTVSFHSEDRLKIPTPIPLEGWTLNGIKFFTFNMVIHPLSLFHFTSKLE